ncbi:conserved Plasmodium protein, unknown function [Plasmodium sp. DRC-Itaito]|nr:conserved Plasmodium protein, unknown function [Plasmodium sp. DRC-Itaito]
MKEGYALSSTQDIDNPEKALRKKKNRNHFKETYICQDKNKECNKYVEKNFLGNIFISKKIKNEEYISEGSKELSMILNDTHTSNCCFKNNKQNISEITQLDKNINIINSKDQPYCDDEAILLYNTSRMFESNTKYSKNEKKEKNNSNISNVDSFKYNNINQKNSENNSSTNGSDIFQSVRSSKSYNYIFTSLNQEKKKNKKNKFINNYKNIINMKCKHMNIIGDIKNQPLEKYSEGFMKKEKMEIASLSFKSLSDDEKNYSFIQTYNDINENIYKKENKKNIKYNNKQNYDTKKKLQNFKELPTNYLLSQKDIKKGSVTNNEILEKEKCKYKKNMSYVKNNMLRKNIIKKQNTIKINKRKMTNSIFQNVHLRNIQENDTIKKISEKNIEKSNESIEKNKLHESLKNINKSIIGRSSICSYGKLENLKNNFSQIKKNVKNAKHNIYTIDKKLENSLMLNKYKLNNFLQDKRIYDCVNKYNTFSSFENLQINNIKVVSSLHKSKSQNITVVPKEKDSNVSNNLHLEKYIYNQQDNKNIKYMYNLKDSYSLKKVNTKSIGVQINVKKKTFNKKTNTVNIFYLDNVNRKKIPKIKFKTITQTYNYDFDAIIVKDGHIISRKKDPLKELFQNFFQKV